MPIYPLKLKKGDEIRVIAPARSLSILSEELKDIANKRFLDLGFKLTFGKHVEEVDSFHSSKIKSRIEDLHEAFSDKKVRAILTVIGGFNSNQILRYLDWPIIRNNPKIFCGFSDITALSNAIYAKTGLVSYSGPHYSSFGEKLNFDYSLDYFKKCLMNDDFFDILPSENWSDDAWYKEQDKRQIIKNAGWWVINKGQAKGKILGGNLCTFNLLQGTEYFPKFKENTILFIEDDDMAGDQFDVSFDRDLQSVIHQPGFKKVKALVIGRCEIRSKMTVEKLKEIISSRLELKNIPVIANVDFGHTTPRITFPIGGVVEIKAGDDSSLIRILKH